MKIKKLAVGLVLAISVVIPVLFSNVAMANGGYPDWNAVDCSQVMNEQHSWCRDENGNGTFQWGEQNSPRGYDYRNCTDWVAWRLPQLGVGSVPHGWGNATNWDNAASGSYNVDTAPEPGDIAVWDGTWGHVAVVESVNSDGTVNISEYNKNENGGYGTRNSVTAPHYIDINGVGNGLPGSSGATTHPAAIVRGDGMEVFYRGVGGTLVNAGWSPGSGWRSPQVLANNVKSNPTAVARDTSTMDVFFVDNQGKLRNVGWTAGAGWGQAYERATSAVGDPVVIARTTSDMDVFYRSTANNLINVGWSAGSDWSSPQVRASGDVASNPTAVKRGSTSMDVFYRSTSNGLRNVGWNVNSGWSSPSTKVGGGLVGDPSAVARSTSDMDVFYRDNGDNLKNIGWSAGSGWGGVNTRSSGDVVSDPSVTARGWNAMEVAYRSHGSNLKTIGWATSNGWGSSYIRGSGLSGEPQIINRGTSAMEVFYKSDGYLKDSGWNSGIGWGITQIPNTNNID